MVTRDQDGPEAPKAPEKVLGKEALRPPLPKRFYTSTGVEPTSAGPQLYVVQLDGRPVRTPKKRALAVPARELAELIAEEWARQGESIDPASMPITKLANTAIDAVAEQMEAVAADIVAHSGSDLLCYRAEGPEGLQRRQAAAWEPILAWAETTLGCRFVRGEGIMPMAQSEETLARVAEAVNGLNEYQLAALHVMTTLTGSALLALAHAKGRLTAEQAWAAAHVDEDWQIEQWGRDEEADARRAFRELEMQAASRMWQHGAAKAG